MCNSESKLYDIDTVLMQHHGCVQVEVQQLLSLSTTTLEFKCHHSGVRVSLFVSLSNITDMVIASHLHWSNLTNAYVQMSAHTLHRQAASSMVLAT